MPSIPLRHTFAVAVIALLPSAAFAQTYTAGALTIDAPWSRATPGGAKIAGGYVRIANTGSEPDRLVGGTLAVATGVEVHEMSVQDGVMRMRPLNEGLVIPPGSTVELKPGGLHLMFMGLKSPLAEGDSINGTLVFDKAGTVAVEFKVRRIGAAAPEGEHKH